MTCGSDGDVRIWENLDDDDPKSINVGEKAFSCALKVRMLTQLLTVVDFLTDCGFASSGDAASVGNNKQELPLTIHSAP